MTSQTNIMDQEKNDVGTKVAATGGILAALAMTSCCIMPLVLFSLGATGAWMARLGALYQYKWFFVAFAGASLAYGFYKVYWPAERVCAERTCERPLNQTFMKISLWTATAVVATSLLFPYVTPYFLGY